MPPVGMKKGGSTKSVTAARILAAARKFKPSGRINADDLAKAKRKIMSKLRAASPMIGAGLGNTLGRLGGAKRNKAIIKAGQTPKRKKTTMTPGETRRAFKGKQTKMFADASKGFKKMMKGIKTKKIGKTRA